MLEDERHGKDMDGLRVCETVIPPNNPFGTLEHP